MKGARLGYIRVSSLDQNEQRQLDGEQLDRTFIDKASGKDINRPKLEELIAFAREGDLILVHSMDRLARNLDDMRRLVKGFNDRKIAIKFVQEGLTFTGKEEPMADLMLCVMGAFAEFERALIRERQREGIALAKAGGKYRGRKVKLSDEVVQKLRQEAAGDTNKAELAKRYGISRETLYRYIRIPATST